MYPVLRPRGDSKAAFALLPPPPSLQMLRRRLIQLDEKEGFSAAQARHSSRESKVPAPLLSAPLCEVGHRAKPTPSLMHGVMGLMSPLLAQGHQNITFLVGGQTFSKENTFSLVKKCHKISHMFQQCYFSWANIYFKNRTLKKNLPNN